MNQKILNIVTIVITIVFIIFSKSIRVELTVLLILLSPFLLMEAIILFIKRESKLIKIGLIITIPALILAGLSLFLLTNLGPEEGNLVGVFLFTPILGLSFVLYIISILFILIGLLRVFFKKQ